jgi:CRP-like cAMP-binding protein
MTSAALKRLQSVDKPATAGQPIRFVLSPRDDPRTEQYRRVALLKKALPFLEGLPPADLKVLAEAGLPYRFEPGQKICNQGDTLATEPSGAFAIYVVEKGNPQAFIEGVGRVHEYAVGEAFGELAPLTNQPRATSVQINVTAKQPAELMVFPGEAVQAAMSKWTDEERQEHYDALTKEYADARAVRDDPRLIAEINELWNIMVRHSSRLPTARARAQI